ncbi:MAG: ribose transport system substrate-binding protein [bacterium]|jgi:ABC-type sugar transport system substrate-binding protein|nr:ribose transport system substrate-binding protein [Solirubrobacteraceae bacterium]
MRESRVWEIDCRTMTWLTRPVSRRSVLRASGGALLGATLLGGLIGCGGSDEPAASGAGAADSGGKPGEGKTIALSLNGLNTFDQDLAEGCLKALAGTSYKFIGAQAGFDAQQEVDNIRQLIARQPDGLIVLAASADGAARAAQAASRAGIPVVTTIWFPVSKEADSVYFAATQLETDRGGQLTVDFIAKDQGIEEGDILEITGLDAQPFTEGFKQGLRTALKGAPGLKIAASQQGFYTADGAIKALRPMLAANPKAKVIIDYAAEMGVAIAQELQRQGRKDIVHITSDINDRSAEWLKRDDGAYLKAARWYSPGSEGIVCTNILRNKIEKDEAPTDANLGQEGYTVKAGTSEPTVINIRQEMATGQNIDQLPPPGYQEFAKQIPFGA